MRRVPATSAAHVTVPDPGALDRQRRRQVRRGVGMKLGAIAVMAAIGLVACSGPGDTTGGENATTPADAPPTAPPVDPKAEEVATGFVEASGAFDAERAVSYLADDADLQLDAPTPAELPLQISFWEAQGYKQILLDPCRETGSSAFGTVVRCPFDFHAIRSDEIGLGPYGGSYWNLTVRDGEIVEVSQYLEIEEFSSQMWEPFRDWVSSTYPKDFDEMYIDGGGNFRLTEESIRLWEKRTREYAKEVA